MDDDSCSKFIGSLTKYLQSLCHSYVDFDNGVELVGHLYLRVDTGKKKIDYVLNESVCKNGSNVVKFTSNSYHAQPVEKKEKEPPKKTPDPPKSTAEGKRADDDVIIVGSEASRRRRSGSSSSQGLPSQSQGTRTGGQPGMGQPQGGMFRHPRGPNPRMATHGLRTGAYPYQPRQRLPGPQQSRSYPGIGPGYNPRMRQPLYQARGVQPHGMRGSHPVATHPVPTDIATMRGEYQQAGPVGSKGSQPHFQSPFHPRQTAPTSLPQVPTMQPPQRHMGSYPLGTLGMRPPLSMGVPVTTAPPACSAVPLTASASAGMAMSKGQPGQPASTTSASSALAGHKTIVKQEKNVAGSSASCLSGSSAPSVLKPSQPATTSVATGGMPFPLTTHSIFDSGPVLPSSLEMPASQQNQDGVRSGLSSMSSDSADPLAAAMSGTGVGSIAGLPSTSRVPASVQSSPPSARGWGQYPTLPVSSAASNSAHVQSSSGSSFAHSTASSGQLPFSSLSGSSRPHSPVKENPPPFSSLSDGQLPFPPNSEGSLPYPAVGDRNLPFPSGRDLPQASMSDSNFSFPHSSGSNLPFPPVNSELPFPPVSGSGLPLPPALSGSNFPFPPVSSSNPPFLPVSTSSLPFPPISSNSSSSSSNLPYPSTSSSNLNFPSLSGSNFPFIPLSSSNPSFPPVNGTGFPFPPASNSSFPFPSVSDSISRPYSPVTSNSLPFRSLSDSSLPYPPASGGELPFAPLTAPGLLEESGASMPSQSPHSMNSTKPAADMYELFNQQQSAEQDQSSPVTQEPSVSQHFPSGLQPPASQFPQDGVGGMEGDGFSELVSELQALNQQPLSHPSSTPLPEGSANQDGSAQSDSHNHLPGSFPSDSDSHSQSPTSEAYDQPPGFFPSERDDQPRCASPDAQNFPVNSFPEEASENMYSGGVKSEYGMGSENRKDAGTGTGSPPPRESPGEEARAEAAHETFVAPYGIGGSSSTAAGHGGLEEFRKRSGSVSSHSHGTPSPSPGSAAGPEAAATETKPSTHQASDYDSGCDSASTSTGERLASPQGQPLSALHPQLKSLTIPLVPIDSPTSMARRLIVKQEKMDDGEALAPTPRAQSSWSRSKKSEWITDLDAFANSEDETESYSEDDDPIYTPSRGMDRGPLKRGRSKKSDRGSRGKKKRKDSCEGASVKREPLPDEEAGGGPITTQVEIHHPPQTPPPTSPQQLEGVQGDRQYSPGTFILVNTSTEAERANHVKGTYSPAEVIAPPAEQPEEGVCVHILVQAGNGLWRLPSDDQLSSQNVDPADIVKTLEKATVKIVCGKVLYKFDDM